MRKKVLVWISLIVICFIAFETDTMAKVLFENKDFMIEELVSGKVISVSVLDIRNLPSLNKVGKFLREGIKIVGQTYNIKSGFPLIKEFSYGSYTSSIILFVEPKEN